MYKYIIFILLTLGNSYDIHNDGFTIFRGNVSKKEVLNTLPDGYIFLDYIYKINCSTLTTFHRDITSSQYVFNSKYPIYTYLQYLNKRDGNLPLLSICPGSHLSVPFLWSFPIDIYGEYGDSVLFNSDLVHAGALSDLGVDRYSEQYKVIHIEDQHILDQIKGTNFITECVESNNSEYNVYRLLSWFFSYPINHLFTNYIGKRHLYLDIIAEYLFGNTFKT